MMSTNLGRRTKVQHWNCPDMPTATRAATILLCLLGVMPPAEANEAQAQVFRAFSKGPFECGDKRPAMAYGGYWSFERPSHKARRMIGQCGPSEPRGRCGGADHSSNGCTQ